MIDMNNTDETTTIFPQHYSDAEAVGNVRRTIHTLPASEGVTDVTATVRNVSFTSMDRIDAEIEVSGFLSDTSLLSVVDYWTLTFRLDVALPGTPWEGETAFYGKSTTTTGGDTVIEDADLTGPRAEVAQLIANMTQRPVQVPA